METPIYKEIQDVISVTKSLAEKKHLRMAIE